MAQSGVSVAESEGHPGRQSRERSPRCGGDSSPPVRRACYARCVWRCLAGRTLSADELRPQRYERGCLALEAEGIVTRVSDHDDRRQNIVGMTETGKARFERLKAGLAEAEDRALAPIG